MRYLLIGLITLVVCAVVFAPASLIENALESNAGISVTETQGSLWGGSAMLSMPAGTGNFELGRLEWRFVPQALFSLCLTYHVELHAESHDFIGLVCKSGDSLILEGGGNLNASLLNNVLEIYDMQVSGNLDLSEFRIVMEQTPNPATQLSAIKDLSAQMYWSGGPIQYRLSGLDNALNLPAMQGELGYENGVSNMQVFEQTINGTNSEQKARIPLILGSLDQNGWISLGITKKFTKLLNQPWPGSEPDHAVVLEVQEKLL